jgi:hypothetical protein
MQILSQKEKTGNAGGRGFRGRAMTYTAYWTRTGGAADRIFGSEAVLNQQNDLRNFFDQLPELEKEFAWGRKEFRPQAELLSHLHIA